MAEYSSKDNPEEIPQGVFLRDVSPLINHNTIPHSLRNFSSLEKEHWARVVVREGEVNLHFEGHSPRLLTPSAPGIISAGARFNFESSGEPGCFQIFYYQGNPLSDGEELASLLSRDKPRRTDGG